MTKFYLLDLERTLGYHRPFFWKGNKHGYTSSLENAGLFSKEHAEMIVRNDIDKTTVMVPKELVIKFLGRDLNKDESTINIIQS